MKNHEDNQFFVGFVTGFIIFAAVLGSCIFAELNKNNIQNIQTVYGKDINNWSNSVYQQFPVEHNEKILNPKNKVYKNQKQYYIKLEMLSDEYERVFRLLTSNPTLKENQYKNCIQNQNGDCETEIVFSVWDLQGDRLLYWDDQMNNTLTNDNSNLRIIKWYEDKIVILANTTEQFNQMQTVYLYDPSEKIATKAIQSIIIANIPNDSTIFTVKNPYLKESIIQIGFKDGSYSPVFMDKIDNLNDFVESNKIILNTDDFFRIDLTNEYNLQNYNKALMGEVQGKETTIRWNIN